MFKELRLQAILRDHMCGDFEGSSESVVGVVATVILQDRLYVFMALQAGNSEITQLDKHILQAITSMTRSLDR